MHKYMSCQFINFMSMSITAARELNNPVLVTLLSDYAKHRTKSKFQYLFIHLLADKYKTNMNMSSDMKLQYLLIKYYRLERPGRVRLKPGIHPNNHFFVCVL